MDKSRSEGNRATIHGRDLIQHGEITATRDGRVLGLKVDLVANMGAYLQLLTPSIPLLGRWPPPAIYKFEARSPAPASSRTRLRRRVCAAPDGPKRHSSSND